MQEIDKKEVLAILKTSRGQMDGVIKMIEDDRYCIDISKQLLAIQALLKKANLKVIDQHIKHCVKSSFEMGQGGDEKVDEIMELLSKYVK